MSALAVSKLSVLAGSCLLVDNASYQFGGGELVALMGPNGAGKTSLLKASLGLERRVSGISKIDDQDITELSASERARRIAYLPQTRPLAWPVLVRDVVALGRFAYGTKLGRLGSDDRQAVERALDACELTELADRHTNTLSGGELARMHFARAFAGETPLLIADEPVAALDPRHQFQIMDLIQSYVQGGGGALVVLHDVSLAARYATRIVWMKQARILADGAPEDLLTPDWLAEIYGIRARFDGQMVQIEGAI